ncbi:MAG: hypothetical protein M0P31_09470 [Solirubrobacteraceae bacterium]|nr:hypothetical protein [Solirubrobacteraceae bacterium]
MRGRGRERAPLWVRRGAGSRLAATATGAAVLLATGAATGAAPASAARTMTATEKRAVERTIRAFDRANPARLNLQGEARRRPVALRSTVARSWALYVMPGVTSSTSSHWIVLRRTSGRWRVRHVETWSNGAGTARWFCRRGRAATIIGMDLDVVEPAAGGPCDTRRLERWLTTKMRVADLRTLRDAVEWRADPTVPDGTGDPVQRQPPELAEDWVTQDIACDWDGEVRARVSRANPRWARVTLRCGEHLASYLVARPGRTGPFTRTVAYYDELRPTRLCDARRLLPAQRVRIDLGVCR